MCIGFQMDMPDMGINGVNGDFHLAGNGFPGFGLGNHLDNRFFTGAEPDILLLCHSQ